MPLTGTLPLSYLQAGLESTAGTAVAATRRQPTRGMVEETIERTKIEEERGSLVKNYRSLIVRRQARLGLTGGNTFEDWPWWLQLFAKGGVTGVGSGTAGYTYTFAPTATSDDLKTATFEAVTDTQTFQMPYALGQRLQFNFGAGSAGGLTTEFLGQKLNKITATGALTNRVTEEVNGSLAKVYIDSTNVGTTQVMNVTSGTFTIDNAWTQYFALTGNNYPGNAYRGRRAASLELTVTASNTTEFDAAVAGTQRLIRITILGSEITGTTGPVYRELSIDWYGYWDAYPIQDENGIYAYRLSGESHYNNSAAKDWQISVVNGLATLP